MLLIEDFIDEAKSIELRDKILTLPFRSGEITVPDLPANIKNNLELEPAEGKEISEHIRSLVLKSEAVANYAFTRDVTWPIINRFDEGMEYGNHTDSALMGKIRSDISFTIFLERPENYKGGALILELPGGPFPVAIKPRIGSIYLYPTGWIHRVNKITKGRRIACVGWIESRIRDEKQREIMREMRLICRHYFEEYGYDDTLLLFNKNIQSLMRLWCD
ncbi:Fe2+-dependent dioxygenase [Methylocystis sp. H62]|uniref:Fe2+-dependent dioxygenase n=1 Tax=Methylocystis sp. H62 TaxID=2785789 RepID=UPI0018C34670|nr:Fe2+-dependent dioxygenase [Methylocystis sp. H62]MBG0792675.1 Fe2+-dependent dioxygenase [Methylocystis sp. H62]